LAFIFFPKARNRDIYGTKKKEGSSLHEKKAREFDDPTILVADESEEFRDNLIRELQARGYNCLIAEDGKQASYGYLEKMPDIAVLGIDIGKKGDGMLAAMEILSKRSEAEVIILTNENSTITKNEECIGIEFFISKNNSLQKIVNSICAVWNLKKSSCRLIAR